MRLRPLIALLALLLLGAPAAAAQASATVSGKLGGGWPASGRGLLQTVEAVNAATGRVVATADAARNRYAITVPAGTYVLVARASDLRRGRIKVLHSPAIKVTRSRKLDLPVKPAAKRKRRASKRATPTARAAAAAAAGGVTGIGPIPMTADPGSGLRGGNGAGSMIDGLLPACKARGGRLVDIDPRTLDALRGEQRLNDNGRTAGPYQYTPLAPTTVVTGTGTIDANGKVIVDIKIIDPQTGDVIQHIRVGGEAGEQGDNIGKLLRHIGDQLGKQECPPPTPATTPSRRPTGTAPAPAAPAPPPSLPSVSTLVYSGTLDGSFQQGNKPEIMTGHVAWSMSAAGQWPAMTWSITSLSGTFTDNGSNTSGCNGLCTPPCSSTLSLKPTYHDVFAPGISTIPGQSGYEVTAYNPADATGNSGSPASYQIQSSGSCPGEAYELLHLVEHTGGDAACIAALHPDVLLPPGSTGRSFNCGPDEIITPAGAGLPYRSTLTITSVLQFNGAAQN
jgi:hypothetical protein